MTSALVAWLAVVLAVVLAEGLWLGLLARRLYVSRLGDLLRRPVLLAPAALFYVAYAAGLVFLAVRPLEPGLSPANVALHGALVGALAYGTYALTNLATVRGWPALISVVDLVWGTALSAGASVVGALATRLVGVS